MTDDDDNGGAINDPRPSATYLRIGSIVELSLHTVLLRFLLPGHNSKCGFPRPQNLLPLHRLHCHFTRGQNTRETAGFV